MNSSNSSSSIAWGLVRDRLPSTTHELLNDIQKACEEHPDDVARSIERALRAHIARLRGRFEDAAGDKAP